MIAPGTSFPIHPQAAAYLSQIPQASFDRAIAYTQGSHWVLVVGKMLTAAAALGIARWGVVQPVQAHWQTERNHANRAAFLCALVALGLQSLILLPWQFYADHVREASYGLTRETGINWLAQQIVSLVFTSAIGALLLAALMGIIRKTGHRWWQWSTVLLTAVIAATIMAAPWIGRVNNAYRPIPPSPLGTSLQQLAVKAGIPQAKIVVYDGSRQSERYTATVLGSGATAQIAVSDTVLRSDADKAAIRAVVAHEIGHDRHNHLIILALAVAALAGFGLWLVDQTFDVVAASIARSGSMPPVSLGEPAGIPILLAMAAVYTLLTTPLVNTAMRWVETDADAYGLELAGEPDGAARALLATTSYRAPTPSRLEEILFYDHPSIARRLDVAMRWKDAHQAPAAGSTAP